MIANTRKILDATTANKNYGVFLQVMSDTGNIRSNFDAIAQANTSYFSESRIRFLRGYGHNTGAYSALLGTGFKSRAFCPVGDSLASLLYKLVNCRH